jgi:hypothetical protein
MIAAIFLISVISQLLTELIMPRHVESSAWSVADFRGDRKDSLRIRGGAEGTHCVYVVGLH